MARARASEADAARLVGMVTGTAGERYALEIERIQAEQGLSVTKAAEIVAESHGVTAGNVIAQRGAWRRSQGIGTPAHPRVRERREGRETIVEGGWEPPKELADILDGMAKNQAESVRLVTALKQWAKDREQQVAEARDKAREQMLREIREATSRLS